MHRWRALRRRLLLVLATVAAMGVTILLGVTAAGVGMPGSGGERGGSPDAPGAIEPPALSPEHKDRVSARERDRQAVALVRDWNLARAQAWSSGEGAALESLYARGSASGRRDREILAAWTRAGWRARGVVPKVRSVVSVRHRDEEWVVDVEELWDAVHAEREGREVALPRGAVLHHRITFVAEAGRWRVLSVADRG